MTGLWVEEHQVLIRTAVAAILLLIVEQRQAVARYRCSGRALDAPSPSRIILD